MKPGTILGLSIIGGIAAFFISVTFNPKDSTDSKSGRSGMIFFTDCLTGVQYLTRASSWSSLTPRLNADGTLVVDRSTCE